MKTCIETFIETRFDQLNSFLYNACRKYYPASHDDAMDLRGEVYERLIIKKDYFTPQTDDPWVDFKKFLFKMVRNTYYNQINNRYNKTEHIDVGSLRLMSDNNNILLDMINRESIENLIVHLEKTNGGEELYLSSFLGMKQEEIARANDVPLGTVASRRADCRKTLNKIQEVFPWERNGELINHYRKKAVA